MPMSTRVRILTAIVCVAVGVYRFYQIPEENWEVIVEQVGNGWHRFWHNASRDFNRFLFVEGPVTFTMNMKDKLFNGEIPGGTMIVGMLVFKLLSKHFDQRSKFFEAEKAAAAPAPTTAVATTEANMAK